GAAGRNEPRRDADGHRRAPYPRTPGCQGPRNSPPPAYRDRARPPDRARMARLGSGSKRIGVFHGEAGLTDLRRIGPTRGSPVSPQVGAALSRCGPSATATTARGCGTFNRRQLEADWPRSPVDRSAALSESETMISVSGAVSPRPSAFTYASFLVQPFRNADTGSGASSSSRRSTSENTRRARDSTSG